MHAKAVNKRQGTDLANKRVSELWPGPF